MRPPRFVSAAPYSAILCWLLFGIALPATALAQDEVRLVPIVSGLDSPVALTHANDDRLFITEQVGRVLLVRHGVLNPEPYLDITSKVSSGGERGLLSVAFHPLHHPGNGAFFVNYTGAGGKTVIARYFVSESFDRADPASERILMEIDQPFSNHNGGQLQFGPDSMLYIGMGDGGSGNDPQCHAQRTDSLLGKMLRIDIEQNTLTPPYYGVPLDNPFVGAGDPPDEVWALGLRNPWRFSFDRSTGDLFVGDVGQNAREEIDWQPAGTPGGRNYGWKVLEGNLCLGNTSGCGGNVPGCGDPSYQAPILDYGHAAGDCSVTGGYVYRAPKVSSLTGKYIYGDFCSGRIWAAERRGGAWTSELLPIVAPQLSGFGEDAAGDLYVVQLSGTVSKIVVDPAPEPGTIELTADTFTANEVEGSIAITARRSGGSDGAVSVSLVTAEQSAEAGSDYRPQTASFEWSDGVMGEVSVSIELIDDAEPEDLESFGVALSSPTGGAVLGARTTATAFIRDNDRARECAPSFAVLCASEDRFEISLAWRAPDGSTGLGQAVPLSGDSGYFWFFDPANVELAVKVLDACEDFGSFWFFAAGLTNVETTITVRDTQTDLIKTYNNPQGKAFVPVLDTAAFFCP